jgi:hypothetical protein
MRIRPMQFLLTGALLAAGGMYNAHASDAGKIDCDMTFNLKGWSAIYKHSEGTGVITCNNGHSYPVTIVAKGGGLTVGKSQIDNGKGKFSDVTKVSDLFGSYAQGEASAGVVKSGTAQVLTKGTVSLALAGAGEGVDLGISFGKFTISQAR